MIKYKLPHCWIKYDPSSIASSLTEAKAAVLSLKTIPYQKRWVEKLQEIELKREIAGTSRIEGADFTEQELDAAMKETPDELITRSQRQAHAAVRTYRWIANVPNDRNIDSKLILEIHRLIVTGADDDHCPPGKLRGRDQNVTFGNPRHRGVEGGKECQDAFNALSLALQREYTDHDPIIQAIAAHYHLAAMHPFLDGNGRTARALEALLMQRAGLRDTAFIAMSNFYYDEKIRYLGSLAAVRQNNHDLTDFIVFALEGVAIQSKRLLAAIQREISKELFRSLMMDLFGRLRTPRKRVIAERQLEILKVLLEEDWMYFYDLIKKISPAYSSLKNSHKAMIRDLNNLITLKAIVFEKANDDKYRLKVNLKWPSEITETQFFEIIKQLPKARTHTFLK